MEEKTSKGRLAAVQKQIRLRQLLLIIFVSLILCAGGILINMRSNDAAFNQELQNTSELITRLYSFVKDYDEEEVCSYMDNLLSSISGIDLVSIVDKNNIRIYHTNHQLIKTKYQGTIPDFSLHQQGFYTENDVGPSGSQRRTYSAIYDENKNYCGFIITGKLKTSMKASGLKSVTLFLIVTAIALVIEFFLSAALSGKIKKEFLAFSEDFEGTKFLVDSMRANNHDFTNKLHVILGLIQIGQYDKAVSYIENISFIQKETVSAVMKKIDNPAFSALLIGKIARACECNVKFILQDGFNFKSSDISLPSQALVTITGNLIDNALDAMNQPSQSGKNHILEFGVFTMPGQLLISVKDNGSGIPLVIRDKIFEKGFSTKGEGRGVGLYHTKQLAESLGAKLSFESQEGVGTCFTLSMKEKRNV